MGKRGGAVAVKAEIALISGKMKYSLMLEV